MLDNQDANNIKDQVRAMLDGQDFILITWCEPEEEGDRLVARQDVMTTLESPHPVLQRIMRVAMDLLEIERREMIDKGIPEQLVDAMEAELVELRKAGATPQETMDAINRMIIHAEREGAFDDD